ncbi:hypothetical protein GQ53DRAFT_743000 [Thozetella sp. PMI_491]|nr:hypothetical protein GQ53DRAFT_743000 [Thozetella sp. PMI_491]
MPFPSEPLVLRGGCNCTAVRWRMSLPSHSERAPNPYHTRTKDIGDVRLPTAGICHCDGCRRASGSIGTYAFITDMATLELSILARDKVPDPKADDNGERPPYVPALSLLDEPATADLSGLWLMHYESSPMRNRWFCGRCGTQLGVAVSKAAIPQELWSPRVITLCGGSTDRDLLENAWCQPDHVMDCSIAIPWMRHFVKSGAQGAQEHPFVMMDWLMTDDFRPHIEMLQQRGIDLKVTMWD